MIGEGLAFLTLWTWLCGAGGQAASQLPRHNPGALPGAVLWRNPGVVENLDFTGGPGGRANAPRGPYTVIEEISGGTSPKLKVRDARHRLWVVKWGSEAKSESFATRLAWAAGYFVLPTYYVTSGILKGRAELGRAARYVD
jgi:hypothetical protein